MAEVLAFDFGTRRIGVAVGDLATRLAHPLATIEREREADRFDEIAALVAEHALYDLLAPIRRVAGYDTVMPLAKLENVYIPGVPRIVDAVRLSMQP
jgi:pyruvate/2-oxoglutarate/acetoin dehydrogenase E1 component